MNRQPRHLCIYSNKSAFVATHELLHMNTAAKTTPAPTCLCAHSLGSTLGAEAKSCDQRWNSLQSVSDDCTTVVIICLRILAVSALGNREMRYGALQESAHGSWLIGMCSCWKFFVYP